MANPERRQQALLAVALAVLIASTSVAYLSLSGGDHHPGSASGGLAAVVSSSTSAPDVSRYISEYTVGGPNSQPNAIASDSRGNIWFTLSGDYAIGELSPGNGTTREFRIPNQSGSLVSWGIAVDKSDGLVWFTDQLGNSVWSFNPSSDGFTRYELPHPLSSPYQIAVDGSGNAWFTEIDGGRIGEVAQGHLREYTVPSGSSSSPGTALAGPAGITIGSGGVVWFTEVYADSVGSFSNGTFRQYPLVGGSSPTGIALGSRGDVWVTLHGGSDIAELDPATNPTRIISTSIPDGVQTTLPYFVAVDPHGNVWFNEHYGNAIARFTPSNQTLVEYEIPTRVASLGNISGALTIGLDPSGHPWFTEFYTGKVGVVDQSGALGMELSVGLLAGGAALDVSDGGNASATILVDGGGAPSTLAYSQGGGPALRVSFSPGAGNGSYSSTMTVVGPGATSSPATVAVTISAVTPDLICSQVIYLDA